MVNFKLVSLAMVAEALSGLCWACKRWTVFRISWNLYYYPPSTARPRNSRGGNLSATLPVCCACSLRHKSSGWKDDTWKILIPDNLILRENPKHTGYDCSWVICNYFNVFCVFSQSLVLWPAETLMKKRDDWKILSSEDITLRKNAKNTRYECTCWVICNFIPISSFKFYDLMTPISTPHNWKILRRDDLVLKETKTHWLWL